MADKMKEAPWMREFITDNIDGTVTAWDETQSEELGTFPDRQGAVNMLHTYAEYIEKENSHGLIMS